MVDVKVLRDLFSFVQAAWCTYIVLNGDDASVHRLLYLFLFFFVLDFKLLTKNDFRIHHLLGITLCLYAIYIPVSDHIKRTIFATEMTTTFLHAITYLPEKRTAFIKMTFVLLFYLTRIQNFAILLVTSKDEMVEPHHIILFTTLCSLFSLNVYWFLMIMKKLPPLAWRCVAIFACVCFYFK